MGSIRVTATRIAAKDRARMKTRCSVAVLVGLCGAATAASGCGFLGPHDCTEYLDCEVINEDGTSNGACLGKCVPEPPRGFKEEPALVWIGPERLRPPSCDDALPGTPITLSYSWVGGASVPATLQCPACGCSAPVCELPASVTASSLAMCPAGPGGVETPLDAPAGWDGACVSPGAVPAERFGSYTIPPATERPCRPVPVDTPRATDPDPLDPDRLAAIACTGFTEENLCPSLPLCMRYQHHPPPGWRHCIVSKEDPLDRNADIACTRPALPGAAPVYSDRFVFYRDLSDTRTCEPCTCTQTALSTCEARVSTYEDTACGGPIATTTVGAEGACVDPPGAMTLGSLSAEWLVNAPGSCAPGGGAVTGAATWAEVLTVCCLPEVT
jgi:hypothetical protein